MFIPENARLTGSINQIDLDFVEDEATLELLMKLDIQRHLAELFLSNIVFIFEVFSVDCAQSTVPIWVRKADLQHKDGQSLDSVLHE